MSQGLKNTQIIKSKLDGPIISTSPKIFKENGKTKLKKKVAS